MSTPDAPDDDERTIVRPASARAGGAMAPGSAIPFPSLRTVPDAGPRPGQVRSPSTSPGHVLPHGTRLRDYEITGLIGEGGFGIVYLAWDHSLQRKVAIKEYMPASMVSRLAGSSAIVVKSDRHLDTFKAGLRSFVNEARLLARFDHPALVKVYRFWEENGTAYMVMPFYEGPTLKTALAELGHVPSENELRSWLDPLLDALTVLHAAQCFHRDISPDNILLTSKGPLLLDFGAARRVIGDMTHALTVVLKPGYAPIEQYGDVASMSQGAWTDIYALACVVYYAITGKTPMSSVERLMDDRLQPIAVEAAGRYGDGFLRAIDAALSVRPAARPQNEAQFRALLDVDRPTPEPVAPSGYGQFQDSVRAGSEAHRSTVPEALMPVPPTQIYQRPQEPLQPESAQPEPAPAAPTIAADPEPEAAGPMSTPATLPTPVVQQRRGTVRIIGSTLAVVALGAAGFWTWQQRGDGGAAPVSATSASAARPASVDTPPAPSTALPTAPSVAAPSMPAASMSEGPAEAPSTAPTAEVPSTTAASTPSASLERAPAIEPSVIAPATVEPAATERSQPPTTHAPAARTPARAPARRSAVGSRCSDILQKASLEPLTADEAAYLKRECR
ncbi:MAG: protein kinase [Pseudomonadota bacterium]|nr:protein kinase [Pseudomonadota bacterium]